MEWLYNRIVKHWRAKRDDEPYFRRYRRNLVARDEDWATPLDRRIVLGLYGKIVGYTGDGVPGEYCRN